jgi:uncharacterized protein (DUF2141 family)
MESFPMISRFAFAVGVLCLTGAFGAGSYAAELQITVDNLRNDKGQLCLCVFSLETSDTKVFPDCDKGRPVRFQKVAISGGKVVITYYGLKDGAYAVAMIHDENSNGQLDTNFLGIPTEGFGVSNNPKLYGSPTFEVGKFDVSGTKAITIDAQYFL